MGSGGVVDREAMTAAFDAAEAALDDVAALDCDALTTPGVAGVVGTLRASAPAAADT
jgi:hypothetical protein